MGAIASHFARAANCTLNDPATAGVADVPRHDPARGRRARHSSCEPDEGCGGAAADETDALVGDTTVSVLRRLRAGYLRRPEGVPQTVAPWGGWP